MKLQHASMVRRVGATVIALFIALTGNAKVEPPAPTRGAALRGSEELSLFVGSEISNARAAVATVRAPRFAGSVQRRRLTESLRAIAERRLEAQRSLGRQMRDHLQLLRQQAPSETRG